MMIEGGCGYRLHDLIRIAADGRDAAGALARELLGKLADLVNGPQNKECASLQREPLKSELLRLIGSDQAPDAPKARKLKGSENVASEVSLYYTEAGARKHNISLWDTGDVSDMTRAFEGVTKRVEHGSGLDLRFWDTRNVRSMTRAFSHNFDSALGSGILRVTGLECWNVAKVQNMEDMFADWDDFDEDIGMWDTGEVQNMKHLLERCEVFNRDIGKWKTGKVTNMSYMFSNASAFNRDIGKWDTSNVEDMNSMFLDAAAFNQDLSRWNIRKACDNGKCESMFWATSYVATAMEEKNKPRRESSRGSGCTVQ